jgi:hypothetical protein
MTPAGKSGSTRILSLVMALVAVSLIVAAARANQAQDKYSVKVQGGLGFSDFRGYEDWQPVSPSFTDASHVIRLIVANTTMINAYKDGIPENGKPFPDGSKVAKIEWTPKSITDAPFAVAAPDTVAGPLKEVEFIEKDSKKFTDTHGWGYAAFKFDTASGTFSPVDSTDRPPQGHDATCGASCHNLAVAKDFIFTDYPKR